MDLVQVEMLAEQLLRLVQLAPEGCRAEILAFVMAPSASHCPAVYRCQR